MRSRSSWALSSLLAASVLAGAAGAQVLPRGNGGPGRTPEDTGKAFQFNIKRKEVSGTVKALDGDKKTLTLQTSKAEMPIDVGPSLIKAGKGSATFADIQVGDKISVYGESTVQGGLRAMEITLPKERMSIAPPKKVKLTPEQKAALKAADKESREKAKADREAKKKAEKEAKEEAKKAKEEAKKAKDEEKAAEKKGESGEDKDEKNDEK